MRIGFLADSMACLGGVETVIVRTARWLREAGHAVAVASPEFHAEVQRALVDVGADVREIGGDRAEKAWLAVLALADCDVVNPHNGQAMAWLYRARRALGGQRVVYSCHEPPRDVYEAAMNPVFLASRFNRRPWYTRAWDAATRRGRRALDQDAVRWAPVVLTNSRYTAGKIREIYGRDAVACYFGPVAGHALEAPGAGGGERRGGRFRTVFAGRLTPMKNLETAIRAVATLDAEFHVIGDGDQRPRLAALARSLGAAERVHFLGTVAGSDLQRAYAAADVALYVPFDEPMGLVPMEAALWGVPSVVSSHAGPAEVVVHERTGLHADACSAESVAAALRILAADPALRRRYGEAARERVRSEMPFARYAEAFAVAAGMAAVAEVGGAVKASSAAGAPGGSRAVGAGPAAAGPAAP